MDRMNRTLLTLLLTLGLVLEWTPTLFAQENETESSTYTIQTPFTKKMSGKEEFTLEEIIVTAQKREENQQKVPITMEVISGEDIQGTGKDDLDEILQNVSAALIQRASDGLHVTIRGVGDSGTPRAGQSNTSPTVAINTDGVYTLRKDTGASLYDIERIEVLYGPQSTIYSSNSPGGVVNIITAAPRTDAYEFSGSLEYGNYDLLRMQGAMNLPLGYKIAVRVSFNTNTRKSYMSNSSEIAEDTKSARLKTLYSPNSKFSVITIVEHSKTGGQGFGGGVTAFEDQDDVDNPWDTSDIKEFLGSNDHTVNRFSATVKVDTEIATISMVPAYSTRKGDNVNTMYQLVEGSVTDEVTVTTIYQKQLAKEKGLELRMTSPSDFFIKWIVGANYYQADDTQERTSELYLIDPMTQGYWDRTTLSQKTRSLYANITVPVMDRVRLTGGYRQSWDAYTRDIWSIRNSPQRGHESNGEILDNENNGRPDYKIGFEYDLSESSMLYGDYTTSARIPNLEVGPEDTPSNEPEYLNAYTLGAKNRFLENKLQVNVAAYYNDYSNFQARIDNQVVLNGELYREFAADQGNGYMIGFDLITNLIITPKDLLDLSVSYIKSEWDDLYFDFDYAEDVDYHGVPMTFAPDWTLDATYSHIFSLWNGGSLKAGITAKYQTDKRLSWRDSDLPWSYQEAFHMENINMSYANADGKWSLSGYVNNISNYAEKTFILSNAGARGKGTLSIGNPRTYGAVFSVKF